MILFVNGDSHTAAAEAVNTYAFAHDDPKLGHLRRLPHPDNLSVSWGRLLANTLKTGFHCEAESAASNARIMRTTREWLRNNRKHDKLLIIQWSTWEREEWLIDGENYQVNGSGIDIVPAAYQEKYKHFIIGLDWKEKTKQAHADIWAFHQELIGQDAPHIFFNGNNDFSAIPESDRHNWGDSYIEPYTPAGTFSAKIQAAGIDTVTPNSYHFGPDGHAFWHRYMLDHVVKNKRI
jgi:hypothetical protein